MSSTKSRSKDSARANASLWKWSAGAAIGTAALAGTALLNRAAAKKAERRNPPRGEFIEVGGVELHYLEQGEGETVLLLHGNGTMIEDWVASGLFEALAQSHRVIAFDRPGFGYSERPRSRIWTPTAQAELIAEAMNDLGVERAVVVGHSFGSLVAAALALDHRQLVSSLVLLGGYYYPSLRADVAFVSPPAIPIYGDVLRYTVSPLLAGALKPRIDKKLFTPAPVPERWTEDFPYEMARRPYQIRSEAAEAAIMIPAAVGLGPRFAELDLPVTIIAGRGDGIVDTAAQSERLAEAIAGSRLVVVEGAGHMLHYTAADEVADIIREAAAR